MSTTIMDGTGRNTRAAVNPTNQLSVISESVPTFGVKSETGKSGAFGTGLMDVTSSVTGLIHYLKNTSSTESFRVSRINVNWAPDTNDGRALQALFSVQCTAPSANSTTGHGGFLNVGTTAVADITNLKWDGVGTGMTTASTGGDTGFVFTGPGGKTVELEASYIIPPSFTMGMRVVAPVDGTLFIDYLGYFEVVGA